MSFAPGDEVVCVDAKPRKFPIARLVLGKHYIVAGIGPSGGLFLVGVKPHPRSSRFGFWEDRFRPVRRDAVDIFKIMCVTPTPLVEV